MNPAPGIVHVVDDDASIRTSLARLLRAAGYDVQTYASAVEFLDRKPDDRGGCVVLDLRMPGPSGLELQEAMAGDSDPLAVVFLTGNGDVRTSVRAMKAGAVDFLTKPVQRDELLSAVERALAQDRQSRQTRARQRDLGARIAALTSRERQVFSLVVLGRLNKQIAAALGTTERTIKAHRAQVMQKLGVESLAELVQIAERLNLIGDAPPPAAGQ